jgi:hypothetical protein
VNPAVAAVKGKIAAGTFGVGVVLLVGLLE